VVIVGAIGVYGERVEQALVGINRLRPHVDRYVVIVDETVTEKQKQQLIEAECEVYMHPWEDSMVKMRNQYLDKIQNGDWVIVHDPDEWFCEKFCEEIKFIIVSANQQELNLLLINSHDVTYQEDGEKSDTKSDFYKNLIYRKDWGTKYEGVGEVKEVHETLLIPYPKITRLGDGYYYEHMKYWHEVWERAGRNFFMAGGGNNAGELNPSWKVFREICSELGIENWTQCREYYRAGKIDPKLKAWHWMNRQEGFDYDHEELEFGRWYFEYLQPEEADAKTDPELIRIMTFDDDESTVWAPIFELVEGSVAEVMRFIEEAYIEVLGRNADQSGKEYYTKMILDGKIGRDQLKEIMKESPEYQRAQASTDVKEWTQIQIPVKVNIGITEALYVEALKKTGYYWEEVKPMLDVGHDIITKVPDPQQFALWFYANRDASIQEIAQAIFRFIGDDGIWWGGDALRAAAEPYPYTDARRNPDLGGGHFSYFEGLIEPNMKVLDVGCQIASWIWAWKDIEPTIDYHGLEPSPIAYRIAVERYGEDGRNVREPRIVTEIQITGTDVMPTGDQHISILMPTGDQHISIPIDFDPTPKYDRMRRIIGKPATFYNMKMQEMEFSEEFDVLFTHTVLQHVSLETKREALPKFYEALKPGGMLIIEEKSDTETKTTLTKEGWIELIESFGFENIVTVDQGQDGVGYVFIRPRVPDEDSGA